MLIHIPGITQKASLPDIQLRRLTLSPFSGKHHSVIHIFTGASVADHVSAFGVIIPGFGVTLQYTLSNKTSFSASELAAIREAGRYILSQPPQG